MKKHHHAETGEAREAESFPTNSYSSIDAFFEDYTSLSQAAMETLDLAQLEQAAACLTEAILERRTIYTCGNGGSAAIANHLLCDFFKGIQTGTELAPRLVSLPANIELLLAIANDITFDDVFVYPLRTMAEKGDVLLTISSSGNSENIVRALQWAKANDVHTIAMTGFDGGRSRTLADISLHIEAANYGIIEDCHHGLMHMLAQYIRQLHMQTEAIAAAKF